MVYSSVLRYLASAGVPAPGFQFGTHRELQAAEAEPCTKKADEIVIICDSTQSRAYPFPGVIWFAVDSDTNTITLHTNYKKRAVINNGKVVGDTLKALPRTEIDGAVFPPLYSSASC